MLPVKNMWQQIKFMRGLHAITNLFNFFATLTDETKSPATDQQLSYLQGTCPVIDSIRMAKNELCLKLQVTIIY